LRAELNLEQEDFFALKAKLAWFKLSNTLDLWSLLLGVIAALGVFFTPEPLSLFQVIFGLSLVLSLAQKYYALRVQYDIALFEAWLSVKSPTLQLLDDALLAQFGKQPTKASLEQRLAGLSNLFNRQIQTLGLQTIFTLTALVMYWLK
jgi:hypothetical protein